MEQVPLQLKSDFYREQPNLHQRQALLLSHHSQDKHQMAH